VERAIVGFHVASTEAGEKRPASIAAPRHQHEDDGRTLHVRVSGCDGGRPGDESYSAGKEREHSISNPGRRVRSLGEVEGPRAARPNRERERDQCEAERRHEDQPPMHLASLSEGVFQYVTSHTTVVSKPRAVEGGAIVETP
jgi:hypothetical protein